MSEMVIGMTFLDENLNLVTIRDDLWSENWAKAV